MLRLQNKSCGCILWMCLLGCLSTFTFAESLTGEDLFKKRCALCHALPDPSHVPPEGWEKRMDMMAPLARITKKQKGEVLHYLTEHTKHEVMEAVSDNDRTLVEQKCSTCHSLGRVKLESFKGNAGRHVLEQMQTYAGSEFLTDKELNRIQTFLQSKAGFESIAPPVKGSGPAVIFRVRCSACHSLERIISKVRNEQGTTDTWAHIVARMREKAPDWLSESEAEEIVGYIKSLPDLK